MKKKALLTVLAATLILSATACGDSNNENIDISDIDKTIGVVDEVSHYEVSETVSEKSSAGHGEASTENKNISETSAGEKSEVSESSSDESSISEPIRVPDVSTGDVPEESPESQIHVSEVSSQNSEKEESKIIVSKPEENSRQEVSRHESEASKEESKVEITKPETVGFMLYRMKDNEIEVHLEKGENVDGYIIEYSTDPHFRTSQTQSVMTQKEVKPVRSLTPDKKYYFRVQTFRTANEKKICSSWSQPKMISLKSLVVVNGVTYIDGLLIANKTYSLPSDYGSGLTTETLSAYNTMAAAAANDGIFLWINSGFRSYYTQMNTYNYFVAERGRELADLCSARPGHSEHQSGLAIDVNTTSDAFAGTKEAIWLENHCAEYGFIIRYLKDKSNITGYKYEPWHIRYVGIEKAKEITESGLTIEEFYGLTSFYQ